jgi:Ca2+-transporting ATPase
MLVPGVVIILERGNVIPADARLILVENLMVKEAALTGESIPVEKQTKELLPFNTPITSQNNMAFKGTNVLLGRGKTIVVAIGMNTQLGKIQQMAIDAKEERTPLEKKSNKLIKRLIWLSLFFAYPLCNIPYLPFIFLRKKLYSYPKRIFYFSLYLPIYKA